MRCIVILALVTGLAAADPVAQPFPEGPLLTVSVPDVAAMRAHFAASWYGALWAQPSNAPVRDRLAELITYGEQISGVSLNELGAHLRSLELDVTQTACLRLGLDRDAAPLLVGVAAAAERDRRTADAQYALFADFYARQRLGQTVRAPEWPMPIVPCQPSDDHVVVGRSRTVWCQHTDNGFALAARGSDLLLGVPASLAATPSTAQTGADVLLSADLPAWGDALGIPGCGDALRLAGFGRADGRLSVVDGRSQEELSMPGAAPPLRAVDTAVLEAEVPATALAISAVGIDGTALAALARRVAHADPLAARFLAGSQAALRGVDGTAWLAVLPGAPYPDVAIAIPATTEVDAWLYKLLPNDRHALDAAHGGDALLTPAWPGLSMHVRRTPRAWLIATGDVLDHLGNPGLAQRLGTVHGIPAQACAFALQANQEILQRISAAAGLANLALQVGALTGHGIELPPPFSRRDPIIAMTALQQVAGAATAPTTVAWLESGKDGVTLHGRDLLAGLCVLPTGGLAAATVLPMVVQDWSAQFHPLIVSLMLASVVGMIQLDETVALDSRAGRLPAAPWQLQAIARAHPIPLARACALELLSLVPPAGGSAVSLPWWRAGLSDPHPEIRRGAMRGLCYALLLSEKKPGDRSAPLMVGLISDALRGTDPALRLEAASCLGQPGQALRVQLGYSWKRPEALLEPLLAAALTAAQDRQHPEELSALLRALGGYTDARIVPVLRAALDHADAGVRSAAIYGLAEDPDRAADAEMIARLAGLRADPSPIPQSPWTLGNQARQTLFTMKGSAATAAIAAELDVPAPPTAGPEPWTMASGMWMPEIVGALVQRDHPGALTRAAAMIEASEHLPPERIFEASWLMPLAQGLSAVTSPESEALLTRLIGSPDCYVSGVAAMGLDNQARHHALAEPSVAALIRALTMHEDWGRCAARRALDKTRLTDLQRLAAGRKISEAQTAFGADAFAGYEPPKAPEPKVPTRPIGADDF